jgi:hypothetical protein
MYANAKPSSLIAEWQGHIWLPCYHQDFNAGPFTALAELQIYMHSGIYLAENQEHNIPLLIPPF